jgi:hypothetical protein
VVGLGSPGRIRTSDQVINSHLRYRCATEECGLNCVEAPDDVFVWRMSRAVRELFSFELRATSYEFCSLTLAVGKMRFASEQGKRARTQKTKLAARSSPLEANYCTSHGSGLHGLGGCSSVRTAKQVAPVSSMASRYGRQPPQPRPQRRCKLISAVVVQPCFFTSA